MNTLEELGDIAKVPLEVEAVLDTRSISVGEILALETGSLIRLSRSAGESIQVHVGGVHIADGDIVTMENLICVRITDFREPR
jgi:flagellar motor switch protein FliN